MNVFLSYYPFDTLDVVSKLDEHQKITDFQTKLGEAAKNMTWAASQMKVNFPIGFFAVPEYYFLKKYKVESGKLKVEMYSEDERDALVGELVTMSDRFNHTVILPGTITWRRPLSNPVRITRRGKQVDLAYEGISSVPVCYRGNVLAVYDKVMNDGTVDGNTDDTRFAPGTSSPVFKVGNLTCGLEICGDFNEKNLAKATGTQSLDFEFMMSATNYHHFEQDMDGIPVRDGGYFLHVDQAPKKAKFYNGVWCVQRGKGSHGQPAFDKHGVYDPWTGKKVEKDAFGMNCGSGHVIELESVANYVATSGIKLPGVTAFQGLQLSAMSKVSAPLDTTGSYKVEVKVSIGATGGSTSPNVNRTVHFSATGATVNPTTAVTDNKGEATGTFTCRKDQAAILAASFHGAKVVVTANFVWLGAGDITKIRDLQGLPHPEVPTFFTPI